MQMIRIYYLCRRLVVTNHASDMTPCSTVKHKPLTDVTSLRHGNNIPRRPKQAKAAETTPAVEDLKYRPTC